jgi:hypothetical protein
MTYGPWTLGEVIGRGPRGVVHRAAGPDGRAAAVKVLHHPLTADPGFRKRFPAEMLAVKRLNHPTVARTFDAGVTPAGQCWFAAELVEGVDLAAYLRTADRPKDAPGLPWAADGVRLFALLARGLMHAHHRSLLHRDLHPGNVIRTPDGGLKLTDFGLAKLLPLPPDGLAPDPWGTAGFLAPEGFAGRPLTKRSDLYSLGAVAYTLICGRPPFKAGSPAEFLHKHAFALPDRPALFAPDLPADLDDLICALLAKDPGRRPGTANLVLAVLEQVRDRQARKGRAVSWPADVGAASEPLAALPHDDPDRPRPLMSRPAVVLPLFLLVVGLLTWLTVRPGPDVVAALDQARPLLASPDPADWERAWADHLEPLGEPDGPHADELTAARRKAVAARQLSRALAEGRRVGQGPMSDSERLYQTGLALVRAGDAGAARRVWGGLAGFAGTPGADPWVPLAAAGLAELNRSPPEPPAGAGLLAAVERLKALPPDQAAAARAALREAYRDDPTALAAIGR